MNAAHVTILGNLGQDPVLRKTTDARDVLNFTVGVNTRRKNAPDQTDWYNVAVFGPQATALAALDGLRKGAGVMVMGRQVISNYVRQDGSKGISLNVIANDTQLTDKRAPQPIAADTTVAEPINIGEALLAQQAAKTATATEPEPELIPA